VKTESAKTCTVGKSVETVYIMVCDYGGHKNRRDPDNREIAIDIDNMFVSLGNMVRPVVPCKKLINVVD
jgi:hypothetical protein